MASSSSVRPAGDLALIKRLQLELAGERAFQALVDLAGDRLRELLSADLVGIALLEPDRLLLSAPYLVEHGQRSCPAPWTPTGLGAQVLRTGKALGAGAHAGALPAGAGPQPGSILCAPVVSGMETIGFVAVARMPARAFRPHDLRLVKAVAASLGVALDKARPAGDAREYRKGTGQRDAELELIAGVQQGLDANLSLDAIVELVGAKLTEAFDANGVAVAWFDEESMQVTPVFVCENGIRMPAIAPFTAQPTEANVRMLRERAPVVVNRVDPGKQGAVPGTKLPRSYMRTPVLAGERVIGLVTIDNFERADAFGGTDVRLLRVVAGVMGVALQTARLRDETHRLQEMVRRRSAELALVSKIQQAMAKEPEIEAITRFVGDSLWEGLGVPLLHIWWWNQDQDQDLDQIRLAYWNFGGEYGNPGMGYPVSDMGPCAPMVLVEQKSFVASNWAEHEALGLTCMPGTVRSRTVAAAPIVGLQRVLGLVIAEDDEREYAIDASALRTMEIVGALLGGALESARLRDPGWRPTSSPGSSATAF
ncbi:GAF domain-containing protein [Variovorax saccharolyticus]|uniref:GAF domain-containing protein n=1 Tax=Variovorax saccharolyticus TaxID=3053516 RepID=UPI0025769596|nr:GAF domain-containing protein [Variovorax sp. J31P216]MDM0025169.1 GAF domain-containing protein [Variovorax sp. J31P216]